MDVEENEAVQASEDFKSLFDKQLYELYSKISSLTTLCL